MTLQEILFLFLWIDIQMLKPSTETKSSYAPGKTFQLHDELLLNGLMQKETDKAPMNNGLGSRVNTTIEVVQYASN